jgi:hypothetical protein
LTAWVAIILPALPPAPSEAAARGRGNPPFGAGLTNHSGRDEEQAIHDNERGMSDGIRRRRDGGGVGARLRGQRRGRLVDRPRPRLPRAAATGSGSGKSKQGATPRASASFERVCMLGLLSLPASRRHTVPYANPEASASCSLVRPARLRAALILVSLGATWFPLEP